MTITKQVNLAQLARSISPTKTIQVQFRMKALDQLEPDDQALVIAMIEGAIIRHHTSRLNAK